MAIGTRGNRRNKSTWSQRVYTFTFGKSLWWISLAVIAYAFFILSMTSSTERGSDQVHKIIIVDDNGNGDVPPLRGRGRLSSDEFLDVRIALPGESVLITGGLGFIGSHVVELLLHRGFDVTILDDESNGHNHNKFARELVPSDITVVSDFPPLPNGGSSGDNDNVAAAGDSYTHVVHLAAAISVSESMNNPDKYERINYQGSQKVLDWIEKYNKQLPAASALSSYRGGIRRVVAASSAAVYGDPDPSLLPLQESAPYGGKSPYAETKYRMETLMQSFVTRQNASYDQDRPHSNNGKRRPTTTSAVALRFFNVYGPRQDPRNPYSGVISLFLDMASTNKDISVLGDGEMKRDFVYVKDVARAIVMALLQEEGSTTTVSRPGLRNTIEDRADNSGDARKPALFAVYNVCTGKHITINTLASLVKEQMESPSLIKHLAPREGDIRDSRCDPRGAKDGMGFVSAVSQKAGLGKTAEWFRQEMGNKIDRGVER